VKWKQYWDGKASLHFYYEPDMQETRWDHPCQDQHDPATAPGDLETESSRIGGLEYWRRQVEKGEKDLADNEKWRLELASAAEAAGGERRRQYEEGGVDGEILQVQRPPSQDDGKAVAKAKPRAKHHLTNGNFPFRGQYDHLISISSLMRAGKVDLNQKPEDMEKSCAPYGGCDNVKLTISKVPKLPTPCAGRWTRRRPCWPRPDADPDPDPKPDPAPALSHDPVPDPVPDPPVPCSLALAPDLLTSCRSNRWHGDLLARCCLRSAAGGPATELVRGRDRL
jgi:hypothetical protein